MAAPVLILASAAAATSYDATALTGGVAGGDSLVGFRGSDFYVFGAQNFNNGRRKAQGGEQLVPTVVGAGTLGNNVLNTITWTKADEIQNTTPGTTSCVVVNSSAGQGLKYDGIIADQSLRRFQWRGKTSGSGAFRVTATLSDGSLPPITYDIPAGSNQGFSCDFRAINKGSKLEVKILSLTGSSNNAYLFSQLAYLEVPTPPRKARAFGVMLAYQGIYGGANT